MGGGGIGFVGVWKPKVKVKRRVVGRRTDFSLLGVKMPTLN